MKNIHGFILAPLLFGQLMSYRPALSQTASPRLSGSQEVSKPQNGDKKSEEKGEFDRMIDDLKSRKHVVFFVCPEGTQCEGITLDPNLINGDGSNSSSKAVNLPKPIYPPVAKAAKVFGDVKVQVIIDEAGKVIAAQVLDGHPLLGAAALKVAREAKFSPILIESKPVKVTGVLIYHFAL